MDFSQALDRIKWGQPMTRVAWNDSTVYVYRVILPPDQPAVLNKRTSTSDEYWNPTQDDIVANDWQDTVRAE